MDIYTVIWDSLMNYSVFLISFIYRKIGYFVSGLLIIGICFVLLYPNFIITLISIGE